MTIKKTVDLELWKNDRTNIQMTGRFLGLVTNHHMALILKSKDFRKRISTGPTIDLKDIMKLETKDVQGKRMLFVAKEIDNEVKADPVLFLTEEIDFVASCNYEDDMAVNGENGSYIMMQEGK